MRVSTTLIVTPRVKKFRAGPNENIRLETPLDFLAITEHAEFLGALESFTDSEHPLFDHPELGRLLRSPESSDRMTAWDNFLKAVENGDSLEGFDLNAVKEAAWSTIVDAADRHNQPGKFTTFAAYEWTAYIDGGNLHRNILFKDTENLPTPFSARDSNHPEDLWDYLDDVRDAGIETLAIPHNPNVSDGRMFTAQDSWGKPIDEHYSERRHHHEPVVEVTQNKGTSETHPDLAPYDPFADFEIYTNLLKGAPKVSKVAGSYAREGLLLGVQTKAAKGFNPLIFGFIGSTDSHAAYSFVEEGNMVGFAGQDYDPTAKSRWGRQLWNGLPYYALSAGGLTGAWAEENSRDEIFNALKRRETFATSGPRMQARAFAGWDFAPDIMRKSDWVEEAYRDGLPMGQALAAQCGDKAPTFLVWARKDPVGANLDRIQVIKGWSTQAETKIKIFDVALSDGRVAGEDGHVEPVGNTVDIERASYTNDIGAAELKARWVDPEFDPTAEAFYYIRVLEIPTPRWSTYDASALQAEIPESMAPWIQERAFGSPHWYEPDARPTCAE